MAKTVCRPYDNLGNPIHRELTDGEVQNYFYNLHDQLVKAEIFKKDSTKETWAYTYDALGRRIGKGRLQNNLSKSKTRGYEQGCIEKYKTLTGDRSKAEKRRKRKFVEC